MAVVMPEDLAQPTFVGAKESALRPQLLILEDETIESVGFESRADSCRLRCLGKWADGHLVERSHIPVELFADIRHAAAELRGVSFAQMKGQPFRLSQGSYVSNLYLVATTRSADRGRRRRHALRLGGRTASSSRLPTTPS